jgi:hypothetical protein
LFSIKIYILTAGYLLSCLRLILSPRYVLFCHLQHHTSIQNLHYHLRLLPSLVALLPIFILICSFIPSTFVSLSDIIRTVNNSSIHWKQKYILHNTRRGPLLPSCYCCTLHSFCSLAVLLLNLTSLICSGTSSSSSSNIHLVVHSGRPMQIAVRQQLSATQSGSDVQFTSILLTISMPRHSHVCRPCSGMPLPERTGCEVHRSRRAR